MNKTAFFNGLKIIAFAIIGFFITLFLGKKLNQSSAQDSEEAKEIKETAHNIAESIDNGEEIVAHQKEIIKESSKTIIENKQEKERLYASSVEKQKQDALAAGFRKE
jgi:hypothetical protein